MKVRQFLSTCLIVAGYLTLTSADVKDVCVENIDTCLSPNGKICNLVGSCMCGRCVCGGEYKGSTCGDGPTKQEVCHKFRDCAECKAFGTGNFGVVECIQNCDDLAFYSMVDEFTNETYANCEFKNEDGCFYYFQAKPVGEQGLPEVILKNEQKCPEIIQETTVKIDVVDMEETYEYTSDPKLKESSKHKSASPSAASRLTLCVLHALSILAMPYIWIV